MEQTLAAPAHSVLVCENPNWNAHLDAVVQSKFHIGSVCWLN